MIICNSNKPSQPIIVRRKQKTRKYGPIADANHLYLCPAVFSHTGEMDVIIKNLLLEQIRLKLQLVDGEVKKSKVRTIMKLCVRHISAAINRSASRNIFLKATKMVNLARHTQQNFSSSSPLPGGPTTCSVNSVYAGVYFIFIFQRNYFTTDFLFETQLL